MAALDGGESLATTGVVMLEVLAGARDQADLTALRRMLDRCRYLVLEEPLDYEAAADLYRSCRSNGSTIRRHADCLIAAVAIRTGASVLHRDADFEALARHTSLVVARDVNVTVTSALTAQAELGGVATSHLLAKGGELLPPGSYHRMKGGSQVYAQRMAEAKEEIDEERIEHVMRLYGFSRETAIRVLRPFGSDPMSREEALAMRGRGWGGDLDEMREGHLPPRS